jgi:hypothetical protein
MSISWILPLQVNGRIIDYRCKHGHLGTGIAKLMYKYRVPASQETLHLHYKD